MPEHNFGSRRVYYNNFAAHLLNAYNPNMLYPDLPHRWADRDWFRVMDMVEAFGFNVFEFWLVPRLFSREGLAAPFGREFIRQINAVIDHAHEVGLKVQMLCSLATVGADWRTFCPHRDDEWAEVRHLWNAWTKALPGLDIVGIFPGDPGACSLNGCTALTYVDRSVEVAELVRKNLPDAEIEFNTWGPPFFGWGIIEGPPGWDGEFVQSCQHTAWTFDEDRMRRSMEHLLERLPDFPHPTSVAINMGFNPDGNPEGAQDARPWARRIARTHPIHTWDFSLTEGENAVLPHYRFDRLFEQRRREQEAAPYSGGICYTMTPLLNQISLFESARSFTDPDTDHAAVAREYFRKTLGPEAEQLADYAPLFEVVPDWGYYREIDLGREAYHGRMSECAELLADIEGSVSACLPVHPTPERIRRELLFFARLFRDLSAPAPDYDALRKRYRRRVYAIYDRLPDHVDPRPERATDNLMETFRNWEDRPEAPAPGQWAQ